MIYLLLIFIVLPVIEISLFIQFGDALGTVNTILLIFLTAGIGVYLVRQQGFNTLLKMQQEIQNQELPVRSLFDGFVILISGILLLIPGFFTDAIGFMGLIPITRFFIGKTLIGIFIKNRSNFAYKSKQDINDPIEGEFEEMDNKDES
jgi:UPF0716 protein FxsA